MTFHEVKPGATLTLSEPLKMKVSINTEKLTTLLRSNISCHMNKTLDQELIDQLTTQIIESIDYFINKTEDNL